MKVFTVCRDGSPDESLGQVAAFSTQDAAEAYAREQVRTYSGYLWSIRTGIMDLDPAVEIVFGR